MALDKIPTIGALAIGAVWTPTVAFLFQIEGELFKQIFATLGIGGILVIGGFVLIKHLFGQNGKLAEEKDKLYKDRIEALERENAELRKRVDWLEEELTRKR